MIIPSFANRIAIYFSLLFLSTIVVMFAFWYFGMSQIGLHGTKHQRISEITRLMELKAELHRALIIDSLLDVRRDITLAAEDSDLLQALKKPELNLQQTLSRKFTRLQSTYPLRYEKIQVIEKNTGKIIASSQSEEIGKAFFQPLKLNHLNNQQTLLQHFTDEHGVAQLRFFREIPSPDGSDKYMFVAFIHLNNFIDATMRNMALTSHAFGQTLVRDQNAHVLTHPETETAQILQTRNLVPHWFEGSRIETDLNNNQVIAVYRTIELNNQQNWQLIHYADQHTTLLSLQESIHTLAILGLIIALFALVLIKLFAQNLCKSLQTLSVTANRLGQGDLSLRIQSADNESDEIKRLASAFNLMAQTLEHERNTLEQRVNERSTALLLAESEKQILFDSTADAVLLIEDTVIIDCNQSAVTLFGANSRSHLLSLSTLELSAQLQKNGENALTALEISRDQLKQKGNLTLEWQYRRLDNQHIFAAEVVLCQIKIHQQLITHATIRDITVRHQIQTMLQQSEDTHRALVDITPEAILIHRNNLIEYANPAALRLFAADEHHALIGSPILTLIHPDFHMLAQHRAQNITKAGDSTPSTEYRLKTLHGGTIFAEVTSTTIVFQGNLAFHSFIHDISTAKLIQKSLYESEAKYRRLIDLSSEGINVHRDGKFIYLNPAACAMFGAESPDALLGRSIFETIHPDDQPIVRRRVANLLQGGSREAMQAMRFIRLDGRIIEVEAQGSTILFDDEPAIYVAWHDVGERKKIEEEQRIAATAFESQEGMFVTDADAIILKVNRSFTEITGYSESEAIGKTPKLVRSERHDEEFYAGISATLNQSGTWQGEIWNRHKNGKIYPTWLTISTVRDSQANVTHYVGTFNDISARKSAEDEIMQLAFYDTLTCLPNRRMLLNRLRQALNISLRQVNIGALLFIDLDNFKTLNDTYGHDTGDMLLQQVANRLLTCVREGDTVARLGGDEFVVMLENLSDLRQEAHLQCQSVAEKILQVLNQIFLLGSKQHHSTPSIGITLFGEQQESIDEPLKRADLAMYQAKAAGRNTMKFFDPEMQNIVAQRAAMELSLREAVNNDQFVLHYQAQINGKSQLTGAEILLRWKHPEHGMMFPNEFIGLAEDSRLILPLGHWVLETACQQLVDWSKTEAMAHLTIAVNVSERQFHQGDFVERVLATIAASGANPALLKFEITESLLIKNIEDVISKMKALKQTGICFSLDDFGTGYSSLSYLKRLPLDQLKIDQSFIKDLLSDQNDVAIAKMIIALADSLNLSVIAEGVETEAQRTFLASLGCQAYQGYLFSEALELEEFKRLVKSARMPQPVALLMP